MEKIDKKDQKILEIITEDSRTSHNAIAKKVALSKNAVTNRIERLKKAGIIRGFFPIINLKSLGYTAYFTLIRTNCLEEESKKLTEHLETRENTLMVDQLLGEWNYLVDFDCKTIQEFQEEINILNEKFSNIIDTIEVHPILNIYKVEQLPGFTCYPKKITQEKKEIDKLDRKLLVELNKDSTTSLIELGKELGVTYETIAARIKRMKKEQIIINFTTKLRLYSMGYEAYLLIFTLRNYNKKRQQDFNNYLYNKKNIRAGFYSSSQPKVLIYLAIKTMNELSDFLNKTKEKFNDIIIEQKYFLSMTSVKMEFFFPK